MNTRRNIFTKKEREQFKKVKKDMLFKIELLWNDYALLLEENRELKKKLKTNRQS